MSDGDSNFEIPVGFVDDVSFAVPIEQFDFTTVCRRLGDEESADLQKLAFRFASEALAKVFRFIHLDGKGRPDGVKIRAYLVAQLISPEIFGSVPDTELCRRIGCKKQAFNEEKTNFRKAFKFTAINMRSEKGCKAMAEAYRNEK